MRRIHAMTLAAMGFVGLLAPAPAARAGDEKEKPAPAEPEAQPDPQQPQRGLPIGAEAPAIEPGGWANVAAGKEPTPASWKGKALFLEFWGVQCGPCIRSMGKVEELFERYGPRGLVLLGVSTDGLGAQNEFAKEHALAFPLAIDSGHDLFTAYNVHGIPMSVVVGKDGKVAAITDPSDADAAIDRALGLKPGAGGALEEHLSARAAGDAATARFHLERIVAMGAPLDLKAWAAALLGTPASPAAPAGGEPAKTDPAAPAKPAPATPPAAAKVDGTKALADLVKAGADAERRRPILVSLSTGGPTDFDLAAWARDVFARDYPATAKDLAALLAAKRYDALVDTIVDRRAPSSALDAAVKDRGLQDHCAQRARDERRLGRRGLMVLLWPLGDRFLKDKDKNEKFWHELSSNGMAMDKDNRPVAIDVDGTMLWKPMLPAWIDRHLARGVAMEALAAGKKPDLAKMAAEVGKRRDAEKKDLETAYGG